MLLERLLEYTGSDAYPFHMPGHKRNRNVGITSFPNPFSVDITEIDGFDNLHHAEGILKESMERAAALYGADRSWYLVNGSSGGILSAVCAAVKPGGRILMARNCHKAAYHAVMLNGLDPVYVYPGFVREPGIQGGIDPQKVEEALDREEGIGCVFLTSPTYEGIVSDVRAIAAAAHRRQIPLIVDEAHGAHLPFGGGFPEPALACGADAVIQSLHKTLPSLTQTAILHLKGDRISAERLDLYLSVFQSSSPSYVFLASIENCLSYMAREGSRQMGAFARRLEVFTERCRRLSALGLLTDSICGQDGVRARDPSKLVVFCRGAGKTLSERGGAAADPAARGSGVWLAKQLRERFLLEPEMACETYVLLMTSLLDTQEGFDRLWTALDTLDQELLEAGLAARAGGIEPGGKGAPVLAGYEEKRMESGGGIRPLRRAMGISEAMNAAGRPVLLSDAPGRISRRFLTVYPPGVPLAVPGEILDEETVCRLENAARLGLTVEGLTDGMISAVEEEQIEGR